MYTTTEAIQAVINDNKNLADVIAGNLRENTSNEQIIETDYQISFLESLLDIFGY